MFFICPVCHNQALRRPWDGICHYCAQTLIVCPPLCSQCGQPQSLCWPQCARPWSNSCPQTIHSFHAVYWSSGTTHYVLRQWKKNAGYFVTKRLLKLPEPKKSVLKNLEFDAVVPIPQELRRSWRLRRGPATQWGQFVSRDLAIPLRPELLELARKSDYSQRQGERISLQERLAGLNPKAYQAAPSVTLRKYKKLLLVDDWMTSGRTIKAAAQCLMTAQRDLEIHVLSLGYRPKNVSIAQQPAAQLPHQTHPSIPQAAIGK